MSYNSAPKQTIIISAIIYAILLIIVIIIYYLGIPNSHPYIKAYQSSKTDHNPQPISKRIQRITSPPKCNNSNHHLLHINPINHNWASYYFRCNYNTKENPKHRWSNEAFVSKQLFYNHIFKAGGSTIQSALNELIQNGTLLKLTPIDNHYVLSGAEMGENTKYTQNNILQFIHKNATLFSFVRDPLDKFLSGFYEAHVRILKTHQADMSKIPIKAKSMINKYDELSGIEIMREWIEQILENIADQNLSQLDRKRKAIQKHRLHGAQRKKIQFKYINPHLRPNMKFLLGNNWSANVPFTFIGNLKNFNEDFPQILEPFIVDERFKRNGSALMELAHMQRSRKKEIDASLMKFSIDKKRLNDEDIEKICEIYWLDYLCFPFDIPVQCDLDGLIRKHYGKDVQYKKCY